MVIAREMPEGETGIGGNENLCLFSVMQFGQRIAFS
jgi:hypothetical protein